MTDAPCEVWFYHLERSAEQVLPELLEKTLGRGWKALVRGGDPGRMEGLDGHLWTYRDETFLPHGLASEPMAERQPVLLTDQMDNPGGGDALFLIDGAEPGDLAGMSRCVLLFDGRDESALLRRAGAGPVSRKQDTPCPTGAKAPNAVGRSRHEAVDAVGREPGPGDRGRLLLQLAAARAAAAARDAGGSAAGRHRATSSPRTSAAWEAQAFVGKKRTDLPAPVDPTRWRVACTTCPVTMDFRPDRLNILFDADTASSKRSSAASRRQGSTGRHDGEMK
jgi:DNA polymerase-3 subunit chi